MLCEPPQENPLDGIVECTYGNKLESVCHFSCAEGFHQIGDNSTECLKRDGLENMWSNLPPVCIGKCFMFYKIAILQTK